MIIYQLENIGKAYDYKNNYHSDWYVPPHIHEFSEFVFTKKGVFHMSLDGKEYTVPENHLIFVSSNQLHECRCKAPSQIQCVVFSNDFIPIFHSIIKGKEFENPVFDFFDNKTLIEALGDTDNNKTLKICGLLNVILDFMLEKGCLISKRKNNQKYDCFQLIIDYISNNFKDDIQLSDVAKRLGYHEKYLSSAMHSLTGMNFRTFLALYRIDYAKSLLLNSADNHYSISEIATKSGFSSLNTFNRMFLKLTGVTPSKFKKEHSLS